MPHVVTERCVNNRYTDCAAVCPVGCFWEIQNPAMLVIDPDSCIDCGLCVAECPVHAIFPDSEVPDAYKEWVEKNAELFESGVNITERKDPLPGAKTLEEIQTQEQAQGKAVDEPSGV